MPWISLFEDDRVARGRGALDQYFKKVHKFGKKTTLTGGFTEIWEGGTHTWPTAAAAVRIQAGGDAADDAAGAGAREITVQGLDENWKEQSETIATAGASASSYTTITFIRVFRAFVSVVGTYHASNTADIIVEDASANTHAFLAAGIGQTQMTQYTTPINTISSLSRYSFTVDTGKQIDIRMYQCPNANDVSTPFSGSKRLIHEWLGISGTVRDRLDANVTFMGATDIWFEALVSTGAASVSIDYDLIISR